MIPQICFPEFTYYCDIREGKRYYFDQENKEYDEASDTFTAKVNGKNIQLPFSFLDVCDISHCPAWYIRSHVDYLEINTTARQITFSSAGDFEFDVNVSFYHGITEYETVKDCSFAGIDTVNEITNILFSPQYRIQNPGSVQNYRFPETINISIERGSGYYTDYLLDSSIELSLYSEKYQEKIDKMLQKISCLESVQRLIKSMPLIDFSFFLYDKKKTSVKDFLVITKRDECVNNHKLREACAEFGFLLEDGSISTVNKTIKYCYECRMCYIDVSDPIIEINSTNKNILLVRKVTEDDYLALYKFYRKRARLGKKQVRRILNEAGYSVSQKMNYSTEQRQKLLYLLVDEGVFSKQDITDYLNKIIRKSEANLSLEKARERWEADCDYLDTIFTENESIYQLTKGKK